MPNERDADRIEEYQALWKLAAYVFCIILVSAVLLAINAGLVYGLATALEERFQTVPFIRELSQGILYVIPVALLYLEWYAWDVLIAMRGRRTA